MKILYYFLEYNSPMYEWQYIHFIEELKLHDIYIETFNPASFENFDQANESLIPYMHKNGPYDLFMSCDESSILYKETVKNIKRQFSIPTLLICWDNLELPYKQKDVAKAFDLVWLTASETAYLFKKWGCKTIFRTFAANPNKFKPNPSGKTMNSLGFIGTPYGGRANRINYLTENEIPFRVYSNAAFNKQIQLKNRNIDYRDIFIKLCRYLKFPIGRMVLYSTVKNQFFSSISQLNENSYLTKEPSVSFDEMCRLYSDLSLSLNFIELRDTHILKTPIPFNNLRVFEIPMSGGLEMTLYNEELASYFKEDEEIVLYRNSQELIDKCRYYLKSENESVVKKMKIKAREKAEREHTWFNRFSDVFNEL